MSQCSGHHGSASLHHHHGPRAEIRLELCLLFNLSTPGRDSTYRLFLDLGILLGLTELPLSLTASYCSEGGGPWQDMVHPAISHHIHGDLIVCSTPSFPTLSSSFLTFRV